MITVLAALARGATFTAVLAGVAWLALDIARTATP